MEWWYLVILLVLVLYQIDVVFWYEWVLFGVFGGIQGFLVFNLIVVGVLLYGYCQVVLVKFFVWVYVSLCGIVGVGIVMIYVGFVVVGCDEFLFLFFIVMLVVCFVVGVGFFM